MSRRKQSLPEPPAKRKRGSEPLPAFGAPAEDDGLLQPSLYPSVIALSTRTSILSQRGIVPSLSSLAARSFVVHIKALSENERLWTYSKRHLKRLPDALVPRLFSMLQSSCPTLLTHGQIVLYFLRGSSLVLSSDLPGVSRHTIFSVRNNTALKELHLIGFDKFADTVFSSVLASLIHLHVLILRGCSKVGAKTAEVIGRSCRSLTTLNLNYTSIPPVSLLGPLTSCTYLQVLKVAGISNWTDGTLTKLLAGLEQTSFPHMKSLKLRHLGLTESSIYAFIARCPNLTHIDVSFTRLHRLSPSVVTSARMLEKLSLTSTALSNADVVSLISALSNIRILYLGTLGDEQGPMGSRGNMTMTDNMLTSLTNVLENFKHLEKLSLVGNAKLGITSRRNSALADVIHRVGRRCKHLNLSGLPYLRSRDLEGLLSETDQGDLPRLEELALNHTGIDDNAADFLASCLSLTVLEVAGTKLTSTGLFVVIDACPNLAKLNLTSCRGIKVADRRRFFEVWESERTETEHDT